MSENAVEAPSVEDVLNWLDAHYDQVARACQQLGIPVPPRLPKPPPT